MKTQSTRLSLGKQLSTMKTGWKFCAATLLVAGVFAVGTRNFAAQAQSVRIEAEAKPSAGDLKVSEDRGASGGKAVSMPREWQPLMSFDVPQGGDEWTLWLHHKGGPLQAKSVVDGSQKELQWVWDKPAKWKWTRVGRWKKADLGTTMLIIRGGKQDGHDAMLDCVVLSTDDTTNPASVGASGTMITKTASTTAGGTNTGELSEDDKKAGIDENAAMALGMIKAPAGVLVEAEANKPGGNNQIVDAEGASGGKAVTSSGSWQNIFQAPVPPGDAFKIWVRHKNGPFMIKIKVDGQAQDRWFWNRPTEWQWTDAGVYARADLGEQLIIGRNQASDEAAPIIDAVVFAPDKVQQLPPFRPDDKAAPLSIAATVAWNKTVATMPAMVWGINEQQVLYPKGAADATYQQLLGDLRSPLIRIHQADMAQQWTDEKTRDWDVAKIKQAVTASTGYGNAKVMVNIAYPPSWLAKEVPLSPTEEDEFAALCARLVRVMRDDVKRKVDYWEVTNEWDNKYEKAGRLDDLWRVYNKAHAAMRKEDPNAVIGGLGFTYAKASWIEGFLKNCGQNAAFVSWHNYATGNHFEPNEKVFAAVSGNIVGHARGVMEAIKKHTPDRRMETFLTETNVKYTWDPLERRHLNNVGAVFLASVARHMALEGVSGVNLWAQKGTSYGSLINEKNEVNMPYHLYRWAPRYLTGKIAQSTSANEKNLEILPIVRTDGTRSLLLISKAGQRVTIPNAAALFPAGGKTVNAMRIDANGVAKIDAKDFSGAQWTIPGYSVTLLTTAKLDE
jgi:xylan 1,4-beta-xylosidase